MCVSALPQMRRIRRSCERNETKRKRPSVPSFLPSPLADVLFSLPSFSPVVVVVYGVQGDRLKVAFFKLNLLYEF